MSHFQIVIFLVILFLLIFLSGFFSCAETALMATNRYRLRHKARLKKSSALLILRLLKRPDRLLGMVLIGNNVSNIVASAIATLLASRLLGDQGVVLSTFLLTLVILIFAEVAPKTLAALYPDRISYFVAWPIFFLLKLFYPFVWLLNTISNGLLRLFRIKVSGHVVEPLSREELRSIVYETSGRLSHQYQNMLLGILDLNKISIKDIMIPRHEVIGIDVEWDWEVIQRLITHSQHDWVPVYRENINQIIGVLHLRELMRVIMDNKVLNKDMLLRLAHEPYFVPESTPLNIQLLNFQQQRKHIALVVDEYGEIEGLITLADILEEIVGEVATNFGTTSKLMQLQSDHSFLIDGAVTIREINRATTWTLPTTGPRTLSGLIIEYLEMIPRPGICIKIDNYPIEIIQIEENRVKLAKVFPKLEDQID